MKEIDEEIDINNENKIMKEENSEDKDFENRKIIVNEDKEIKNKIESEEIKENIIIQSDIKKEKEKENTILNFTSKIKVLKDNYTFFRKYQDILFNIMKQLENVIYETITNSINDNFNYISFFKATSELYSNFADQIKNTNDIIMPPKNSSKEKDNFLLEIMQNTQNMLHVNISKLSNLLKQNIITKGPFSTFQEKINKINTIKKNQSKKFNEIEEMRIKIEKKYKKNEKLFDSFLEENINNDKLCYSPDLIFIIKDLLEDINKFILEINLFIIDIRDNLYSINHLFIEINNLIKDSLLIYIQESKNIFNIDLTKNFEKIQKYYKDLEDNPENKMFKFDKIFDEQKDKELIYDSLEQLYNLLNNSKKVKKDLIEDKNNFSINKYPNIYLFFEWLISISPQPIYLNIDDLIIKKVDIKRDAGYFKGWKDSVMVFTKQQHAIVYDKPFNNDYENSICIFELDKITFKQKVDYKNPFLFEINAHRKGTIVNYKETFVFDALNNENLYDISLILKDFSK